MGIRWCIAGVLAVITAAGCGSLHGPAASEAGQPVAAAGTIKPSAAKPDAIYTDFQFVSLDVRGVTLHVQRELAGSAQPLALCLDEWLAEEEKRYAPVRQLAARADEVVAETHRLVGLEASKEMTATHARMFRFLLLAACVGKPEGLPPGTVYVLDYSSVKEYLESGKSLPDLSYNKAHDKLSGQFFIGGDSDKPDEARNLQAPVRAQQPVAELRELLEKLEKAQELGVAGLAMHEIVEASIIKRLCPADPWVRWFNDGFANALAIVLLEKYCGEEEAQSFAASYDTATCVVPPESTNLLYWPALVSIDLDTPGEKALQQARYTYATAEARRLLAAHGPNLVDAILDKATSNRPVHFSSLIDAIKETTGENMLARLVRYQTFKKVQDGWDMYLQQYQTAQAEGNQADSLRTLMRLCELVGPNASRYAEIAYLMKKAGDERATTMLRNRVGMAIHNDSVQARYDWLLAMCVYALEAQQPELAFDEAEQLLQMRPKEGAALTIGLVRLVRERKIGMARALARQLLADHPQQDLVVHRAAAAVLKQIGEE